MTGTRALTTIMTNLSISWEFDPRDQETTRWHARALEMLEGVDVTILAGVVDKIRSGKVRPLEEIKELVRVASKPRGSSQSTGYHHATEKVIEPIKLSVINAGLAEIHSASAEAISLVMLARGMVNRERQRGNVRDDAEPHALLSMAVTEIGPWLQGNVVQPTSERPS